MNLAENECARALFETLAQFYDSRSTVKCRRKAEQVLQEFQRADWCLPQSVSIMEADASHRRAHGPDQSIPIEYVLFCAQCTRHASQKRADATTSAVQEVTVRLLTLVQAYSDPALAAHTVAIQLSLAAAALLLRQMSLFPRPFEETLQVLSEFYRISEYEVEQWGMLAFLHILRHIAEQCRSRSVAIGISPREECAKRLLTASSLVLRLSRAVFEQDSGSAAIPTLQEYGFQCITAWVENDLVGLQELVAENWMQIAIKRLTHPSQAAAAEGLITAAVEHQSRTEAVTPATCSAQASSTPNTSARYDLLFFVAGELLRFKDEVAQKLSQDLEGGSSAAEVAAKIVVSYCRAFVSTCRQLIPALVLPTLAPTVGTAKRWQILSWLKDLITISRHADSLEDLMNIVASLYAELRSSQTLGRATGWNDSFNGNSLLSFVDEVACLVVNRASYPVTFDISMDEDDRERFIALRKECRQVIRRLFPANERQRSQMFVGSVVEELARLLDSGTSLEASWRHCESILHGASAVIGNLDTGEDEPVCRLVQDCLLRLKHIHHPGIACTVGLVLTQIVGWLQRHTTYVLAAMELAMNLLSIPEEGHPYSMRSKQDHVGAVALFKICLACRNGIKVLEAFPRLLVMFRELPESNICKGSRMLVLQSCCTLAMSSPHPDAQSMIVSEVYQPTLEELQRCLHSRTDRASTVDELRRFSDLLDQLRIVGQAAEQIQIKNGILGLELMEPFWHLVVSILSHDFPEDIKRHSLDAFGAYAYFTRSMPCSTSTHVLTGVLSAFQQTKHLGLLRLFERFARDAVECQHCGGSCNQVEPVIQNFLGEARRIEPARIEKKIFDDIAQVFGSTFMFCLQEHPRILASESTLEAGLQIACDLLLGSSEESLLLALSFLYGVATIGGGAHEDPSVSDGLKSNDRRARVIGRFGKATSFQVVNLKDMICALVVHKDQGTPVTHALLVSSFLQPYPWFILESATVLRAWWVAFGDQSFADWLAKGLQDDTIKRSTKVKERLFSDLTGQSARRDERKFKRYLKSFCQ